MGTRARNAGVDAIMDPAESDRLGTNRREARKIVRAHDFFLADTAQMSTIGRSTGYFLGKRKDANPASIWGARRFDRGPF